MFLHTKCTLLLSCCVSIHELNVMITTSIFILLPIVPLLRMFNFERVQPESNTERLDLVIVTCNVNQAKYHLIRRTLLTNQNVSR